jgi:RNA polymerase sigma-70 factor (ECF subfamily)
VQKLLEDKILVWQFKKDSKEALASIYEKYRDDLLRIAGSLLNQKAAAEDIVHDVFISFVRNRHSFTLTGSLKAYLVTAVVNRVRNSYKAKSISSIDESAEIESRQQRPEHWIIHNEQTQILNDALEQLPIEQREAVALHIHGNMKFHQIAKMQEVSIKTAQSRYRYGIDKLRSLLNGKVTL